MNDTEQGASSITEEDRLAARKAGYYSAFASGGSGNPHDGNVDPDLYVAWRDGDNPYDAEAEQELHAAWRGGRDHGMSSL